MNPPTEGPFSLVPNKHPGACWFCARRVKKASGALWREVRASGAWTVGHVDCVAEGIAAGHGPQVAERGATGCREAEMRARLEAGLPALEAPPVPPVAALKRVREVMRAVRLDDPDHVLAAALAEVRAAVLGEEQEAAPF